MLYTRAGRRVAPELTLFLPIFVTARRCCGRLAAS